MSRGIGLALTILLAVSGGIGCRKSVYSHTGAGGPSGGTSNAGVEDATLYTGPLFPLAITGIVGDYYFEVLDSTLFGPKTALGWGSGLVLSADPWPGGSCALFAGNEAPPVSTGNPGDFYINMSQAQLYGPKNSSGWGPGLSLATPTSSTPVAVQ